MWNILNLSLLGRRKDESPSDTFYFNECLHCCLHFDYSRPHMHTIRILSLPAAEAPTENLFICLNVCVCCGV